MRLNLICSGNDLRSLEQFLGSIEGKVTNTNTANLACRDKLLQSGPSVGHRNIGYAESLRDRIGRCESLVGVLKSDRPMDLQKSH